jgi:O-succinylbenzoic acid--CoA ligase
MIHPTFQNVHNQFKLNGFHFNKEDLIRVAYSFIKEGDAFEKPVGNFIYDWFDNNSFLEIKTSGSTGAPKVIKIEKQAMVNSALATGDFFNLHAGNKALLCLPMDYIAGKMMFVRALILGLDLDFIAPTSNPLKNNTTQYDFVAMVPMKVENSLKELVQVKKLIVGGVAMNFQLQQKLMELPTQIFETYGMTETSTHIAVKKLGSEVFNTLPNVEIGVDERNCLTISAHKISAEKIVTNDIVELISSDQFIFKGRIDNVINSGGVKLFPEQIEAKLNPFISNRFYISSISDDTLGQKAVLVIESEPIAIDDAIFEGLSKYERPKQIIFKPKFDETPSGKVIRN